ncbi:hypothetical protein C2I18_01035 [Paenibacillus sp. PK3_47]|uniref:hypothetical protein n=1 Tax=Paenibacillus sp. PK3_47 TaxID=2072642 RepID=UPI00201E3A1C|nr:hypothetical protein [Paenibacillus sp. PK3_47]UQZ32252.1 hypothetical protein C2I18_01035 [Paenibacillus sp. PK3_47]
MKSNKKAKQLLSILLTIVLFLSSFQSLGGVAVAQSADNAKTISKNHPSPSPSPMPGLLDKLYLDSVISPTPTPTPGPLSSKRTSQIASKTEAFPLEVKATVDDVVYGVGEEQEQPPLILILKTLTLEKQGRLNAELSRQAEQGPKADAKIESISPDLSTEEIKQLAQTGASQTDIYWINLLIQDAPEKTPLELLKWYQQGGVAWEDIQRELERDHLNLNVSQRVADSVYQIEAPLAMKQYSTVAFDVYGEPAIQQENLAKADSMMTAFDMTVSGVIEGVKMAQINQTNKPQFEDRSSTNETVDPVSGNLTWKKNLIHLPGRDGLDLELGLMYNSSSPYAFKRIYDDYWGYSTQVREPSPLGMGWSF